MSRANDELNQFAYRASHDLRSPLVSISRLTEYLRQDVEDGNLEEVMDNLARVDSLASRLDNTVKSVLDLHKSGYDDQADREPFEFTSLVHEVRENLDWLFEETGCELNIDVALQHAIAGHRTRFQQILENLVSNSVKYRNLDRDSCSVTVKCRQSDNALTLDVIDNGLGIPEEYHADVMGMFKRFHPRHAQGTGLGLAIVKKHVDVLKGRIEFQSSDAGTAFRITVPVKVSE